MVRETDEPITADHGVGQPNFPRSAAQRSLPQLPHSHLPLLQLSVVIRRRSAGPCRVAHEMATPTPLGRSQDRWPRWTERPSTLSPYAVPTIRSSHVPTRTLVISSTPALTSTLNRCVISRSCLSLPSYPSTSIEIRDFVVLTSGKSLGRTL